MLRQLQDFFFPRTCIGCDTRLASSEQFLCPSCRLTMPYESLETDWQLNRHVLRWRSEHPSLVRMGALCIYRRENTAARMVHQLKFGRDYKLGLWMGQMAAKRLGPTGLFDDVDALVPLPLSSKRRRRRGFNQAESIVEGLSQELNIPMRTDLLCRVVDRESQTHFRLADRFRNGQHVFSLAEGAEACGQHLMLVDDVLTTGTTMMSAVGALEALPEMRLSTFAWAWVNLSSETWTQARREAET